MSIALVRPVSTALMDCELTHLDRAVIDVGRAVRQHCAYVDTLRALGCVVRELPVLPAQPDAVFVEDVVVVVNELAVLTRPGAPSRRAEVESMASVLAGLRTTAWIAAPGTLDGGDVLRVGKQLWVGRSLRSNAEGHAQLDQLLAPFGYTVSAVPLCGCLHLKSAVSALDDHTLLIQPEWVPKSAFAGWTLIEVDPDEPHAANILRVGSGLIYPDCFPRTLERLRRAGFAPYTVDVSELQKAEGAVTCCSVLLD